VIAVCARGPHAASALLALALGCASAPPAPDVPSWQRRDGGVPVADGEPALWDESARAIAKLESAELFVGDPALDMLLAEVLHAMTPPLDDRAPELRARMVKSADQNAGALSNGAIVVSVSLLAALRSESELAGLLGHEIAHVVFRHVLVEREYAARSASTVDRSRLARQLEQDADSWSLARLSAVGYDPAAMPAMLHRIDPDPRSPVVPEWEDHPDLPSRIRRLEARVPETKAERTASDRYPETISRIRLLAAEIQIEAGELARAEGFVDRELERAQPSGRAYYLKGEIARHAPRGRRDSAAVRAAYERAVEIDPDDPDALRALGLLLREAGERERARDLFERYLRAAPDAVDRAVIQRYLRP
jgi:beta-barrel assembly-enhancing protease